VARALARSLSGLVLFGFLGAGALGAPAPALLEGTWQGAFEGLSLRIVLHVTRTRGNGLAATMDSPDQGALGLAVDTVIVSGDSLRFRLKKILADYAGAIAGDGSRIVGRWRQGNQVLPLTLARSATAIERPRRPQEPMAPLPYEEDTVRVTNRVAGVSLAGTLTRPRGSGPFPAAVLVTGSGPEDRDETVFGHKPFLVLADDLTRHGIAVLRLDDRGVGGSSGDFPSATSEDFASDAEAAVEFLAQRPGIDSRRIGLIGHSEGGLVAPMVGARSTRVAFLVLLAAPGVPGDSILIEQSESASRAMGADEATVRANRALEREVLKAFRELPDSAAVASRVRELVRDRLARLSPAARAATGDPDSIAEAGLRQLRSPWLSFFVRYDPRPTLRRVRVPVLALNGSKDVQVEPRVNLPAVEQALRSGGNRDVTVKEMPGLNHLFQTANTGDVTEYAHIEETFAPAALDEISRWILRHAAPRR
jgi:uncharacterized protein